MATFNVGHSIVMASLYLKLPALELSQYSIFQACNLLILSIQLIYKIIFRVSTCDTMHRIYC